MKKLFDFVIGNPPFQESRTTTKDMPVYNYFMDGAESVSSHSLLITPGRFLCEILETEQLYGQLFDVILRSNNIDLLHQYTHVLNDEYPEKLIQLYREFVEKQAESTGSRKHYYQIVEELRIMKSITGGDKVVDEIIKKWKIQYKNRSAMLDELNRV